MCDQNDHTFDQNDHTFDQNMCDQNIMCDQNDHICDQNGMQDELGRFISCLNAQLDTQPLGVAGKPHNGPRVAKPNGRRKSSSRRGTAGSYRAGRLRGVVKALHTEIAHHYAYTGEALQDDVVKYALAQLRGMHALCTLYVS